jgi:hypothetical protein
LEQEKGNMLPATKQEFNELIQIARGAGASDVGLWMPLMCRFWTVWQMLCGETPCDAYGLSGNCPPHVSGPDGFRELRKKMRYALVFRIDIPEAVMFSNDRNEVSDWCRKP